MKNEWDFFADVQRRLASGQQMVQGYFAEPLAFPFDSQRGLVLDEDGNQYQLQADFKRALDECAQQAQTAWGLCFQERLIRLGPAVTQQDATDYLVAYTAAAADGSPEGK